jgi:hypothetical protein
MQNTREFTSDVLQEKEKEMKAEIFIYTRADGLPRRKICQAKFSNI